MSSRLLRKLESFAPLSPAERDAVDALCSDTVHMRAGENLILEGERPARIHLLVAGWGFRYKLLADGGRQIMAYLIPGDLCDMHIVILRRMDHSIGLLSDAEVARIEPDALVDLLDAQPRIGRALHWATLVDEAILREWLVNMGRRDPHERVAHLLCEMWARMKVVGLVEAGEAELPLTQAELGDTIGLTPVTVNRVLQRLRGEGLITLAGERLAVPDPGRLAAVAGFDANYLHLGRNDATAGAA